MISSAPFNVLVRSSSMSRSMKILIISPGKNHDAYVVSGIEEFTTRISRYAPVEWKLISVGKDVKEEAGHILKAVGEKDFVVLLDERGKELSSVELSQFMEKRFTESTQRIVFVIGGAYGVDEVVKSRANFTWSLSKLVFPHQLVRLILSEQLYRAFSILRGEKYHHA
jgi:23S rRNA (pseudouridine1915-N3)-methyltransferase